MIQIIVVTLGVTSIAFSKERWFIQFNPTGKPSLVCELDGGKKLTFMSYYIESDQISDEVKLQYKKDYARLWDQAVESSGNMHNPKVLPLRTKFKDILLKTPTLIKLDQVARKSGYTISGVEHEKLHLMKKNDKVKVFAVIWLKYKKVTEE